METINLIIVDDHKIVREGLKAFIAPLAYLHLIGEAATGREAVALTERLNPDVILMDLIMPDMDGIQATELICRRNSRARILMITSFAEDERIMAAIQAGGLGYLLKDSSPRELEEAIQAVYRGESYLPPRIARKVIRQMTQPVQPAHSASDLTEREVEIVRQVAQGNSNDLIARALCISPWTVRSHLGRIMKKLGADNRTQVALYAIQSGLAAQPKG